MSDKTLYADAEPALVKKLTEGCGNIQIASVIAASALFDVKDSRQLLSLHPADNELIQFDVPKAVLAAAGVLGATIPIVLGTTGIASILAALGALGALQGLKSPLPETCAQIVSCLLPNPKISRDELEQKFKEIYDGPGVEVEYKRALEQLAQIGSIRIRQNEVRLVERVMVRW